MKQETKVKNIRIEDNNDNLTLNVNVGNGQPSVTIIYMNGKKTDEKPGSFSNYPLGKKSNLIGTDLLVVTTIHDLPENPNNVSTEHFVKDPNLNLSPDLTYGSPVDEGEVAVYSSQVNFLIK